MHGSERVGEVPGWFTGEVAALFALYPGATAPKGAALAWWRYLHVRHELPEKAIRKALLMASKEGGATWVPSAELVRQIAAREARTGTATADFTRPCLPEPEPTLPEENPFYDTLERMKRGEVPGKGPLAGAVSDVVANAAKGGA